MSEKKTYPILVVKKCALLSLLPLHLLIEAHAWVTSLIRLIIHTIVPRGLVRRESCKTLMWNGLCRPI